MTSTTSEQLQVPVKYLWKAAVVKRKQKPGSAQPPLLSLGLWGLSVLFGCRRSSRERGAVGRIGRGHGGRVAWGAGPVLWEESLGVLRESEPDRSPRWVSFSKSSSSRGASP